MDLRLTFNEVPAEYDKLRPVCPDNLFIDVISFASLDKNKKALEIGIGTGQASLPFLKTGCALTAIEIGDKLAQYSKEKFAEYKNFKVINQDFESVVLEENYYDFIYSVNAFHWILPEVGMSKALQLLKPNGVFAWISVQPAPSQQHMHDEIQNVYTEYSRYFRDVNLPFNRQLEAEKKLQSRIDLFNQYGFVEIEDKFYYGSRALNANEYATLCGTYSDHRAIPEVDRTIFLQKLENVVNNCGGEFTFTDTFLLCMGKKPV